MDRQKSSGRPVLATTLENQEAVEELICSQEDQLGIHLSPREIAEELNVSHTSVSRMVKQRTEKRCP